MTDYGNFRGHPIYCEDAETWRLVDSGERLDAVHEELNCALCGEHSDDKGHDPCMPYLPGVINACCGHGEPRTSYIMFEDGRTVRGFDRVESAMDEEDD